MMKIAVIMFTLCFGVACVTTNVDMSACEYTLDKMPVQGEALLIDSKPAAGLVCWEKPNSGDVVLAPHVNGLAEGTISTYSKAGALISLVPYKNGVADGIAQEYYESGELQRELPYKNGVIEGLEKLYDKAGGVFKANLWTDSFNSGAWTRNTDLDGEPFKAADKQEADSDGIRKAYYSDGSLWRELPYKNGKPHGTMKRYGKHGRLIASIEWRNGNYAGAWASDTDNDPYNMQKNSDYTSLCDYYEDETDYDIIDTEKRTEMRFFEGTALTGNVCTEPTLYSGYVEVMPYVEGLKNGVELQYARDGRLWQESTYKNGKMDGIMKNYAETGWIYHPAELYRDGVWDEEWYSTTDLDGKPIDSRRAKLCDYEENEVVFDNNTAFLDDQPVTGTVCTTTGRKWERIVTVYPFIAGKVEGVVRKYIDSQQQAAGYRISETPIKNGEIDGILRYYISNELAQEISYKNGVKDGIAKRYNSDYGTIYSEMIYVNDVLEGVNKEYYEDGKLRLVRTMKNGKAEGEIKGYAQDDGSLILLGTYKNGRIISMQCTNGQPLAEKDWGVYAVFDCD